MFEKSTLYSLGCGLFNATNASKHFIDQSKKELNHRLDSVNARICL